MGKMTKVFCLPSAKVLIFLNRELKIKNSIKNCTFETPWAEWSEVILISRAKITDMTKLRTED